jgi:COP9 signalosome complex subunit 6
MAAETTARTVALHPLAIVGVSDHFTRVIMGGTPQGAGAPVVGLLFGQQNGLEVDVVDVLEVHLTAATKVDREFLEQSKALYTEVYEDRDLVGWYAVAAAPTDTHLHLHKEFAQYNENPLFLLMEPQPKADAKDLPIALYETRGAAFATVPWALETTQTERVALEAVAQTGCTDRELQLEAHVDALDPALKTLSSRVRALRDYLAAVQGGTVVADQALLRKLGALCDRLPALASDGAFEEAFLRDSNDALAAAFLAAATKNAAAVNDLSDKFVLVNARGSKLV